MYILYFYKFVHFIFLQICTFYILQICTFIILKQNVIDDYVKVNYQNSVATMKELAKKEGIFAGISSGAVLWATLQVAKNFNKEDTLLCLLGDTGERYLSSDLS